MNQKRLPSEANQKYYPKDCTDQTGFLVGNPDLDMKLESKSFR